VSVADFDEEDITNAYGALLESGALIISDVEIHLNEDRVKKRGHQIYKIMIKYNLSIEYMDLLFVGTGIAGDCINVYQQVKAAKSDKKTESTDAETISSAETKQPHEQSEFRDLQARVKI